MWSLAARVRAVGLVRDRTLRFRNHPDCLIARELVDWLVSTLQAPTRNTAIALGCTLHESGWLEAATGKEEFGDNDRLFRLVPSVTMQRRLALRQHAAGGAAAGPGLQSSPQGSAGMYSPIGPSGGGEEGGGPSSAGSSPAANLRSFTLRARAGTSASLRPPVTPLHAGASLPTSPSSVASGGGGVGGSSPTHIGGDGPTTRRSKGPKRASLMGNAAAGGAGEHEGGGKRLSLLQEVDMEGVAILPPSSQGGGPTSPRGGANSSGGSVGKVPASGGGVGGGGAASAGGGSGGRSLKDIEATNVRAGWLFKKKKGRTFMLWKRRWCMLRGVVFSWYKKQGDRVPAGCIDISAFRFTIDSTFRGGDTLLLEPLSRGRGDKYLLQCKTESNARAWMEALRGIVAEYNAAMQNQGESTGASS